MRALVYNVNPAGWLACKLLKRFRADCVLTSLGGLTLRETDPPTLPGADWVRLRTLLGGICGSDVALIAQKQPPDSLLQAYTSFPMGLGHEGVAVVEEVGTDVDPAWTGRRVCVEPTLCCEVRGIDPPCPRCRAGEFGACESFAAAGQGRAGLPAGMSIGYNARTGGTLGERFVGHVGRLVEVPEALSDEQALLTDPLACSLHAALRADLFGVEHVLVYGAGVLGLGLIAGLRALGFAGRIEALDVHAYLSGLATRLGADEFFSLPPRAPERFARIARRTGGTVQRARFGNYALSGGYDLVFDCVGSPGSMSDALRWTRSGGQVVFVGTGHGRGVDMTPIWFRELRVTGAYGRQIERVEGREIGTYELVHELMTDGRLDASGLLTHTFRPEEYREAFRVAMDKPPHRAIKIALDFRDP